MGDAARTKWILPAPLIALTYCQTPLPAGTPAPPKAATAPANVAARLVGIHDGDSLTVLIDRQQVKVRIEGIDAPEHRQDVPWSTLREAAKRSLRVYMHTTDRR